MHSPPPHFGAWLRGGSRVLIAFVIGICFTRLRGSPSFLGCGAQVCHSGFSDWGAD